MVLHPKEFSRAMSGFAHGDDPGIADHGSERAHVLQISIRAGGFQRDCGAPKPVDDLFWGTASKRLRTVLLGNGRRGHLCEQNLANKEFENETTESKAGFGRHGLPEVNCAGLREQ